MKRRLPAVDFDRAVAEFFMGIALDQARKGVGRSGPHPVVGAILVKGGRVVGRGFRGKATASKHAEVVAIEAAGSQARGADLDSTLEPGCVEAIVGAGVQRIFFGLPQPEGQRRRRTAIAVKGGVRRDEADALNRPYFKWVRERRPFVTLKAAATLDGKLATATGDSRWVTGEAARLRVHQLRDQVDAVLVGATTAQVDDPRLTTRLPRGHGRGRNPMRVVVDSHLRLSPKCQLFSRESPARVVVATLEDESSARGRKLTETGAEVWRVAARRGRIDLVDLLRRLARDGCVHLLVEGGSALFGDLLARGLADELWLFLAPKLVGSTGLSWVGDLGVTKMAGAMAVREMSCEKVGEDLLVRATFE